MSKERSARAKTQVPELLAPAGGPAAFYAALAAGADAIYCGLGSRFNARRGAGNFEDADFAEACRTAHLAGARVYVTENVVIKTDEVPAALALVKRAWDLGADAVILQDWGLMAEVRRQLPEVEVHVSTQANVHDARAVAWCRDVLGVGRVTLSRELSLREIARIAQEGVELENFGHGALCFCYSGVCKMSALGGDRSANRGMCAQPCRLPYDLVDEQGASIAAPDRGRPLCPKDYRTIDHLAELADAGLGSLKVEGRMKAPDYVWGVVCAYRAALDALTEGRELDAAEGQRLATLLKRSFNRDFTDAYLYGRSGDEMMSYDRSNNRGELVGVVTGARDLGTYRRVRGGSDGGRVRTRAYTAADVTVRLDLPVGKGDLLELRPPEDPSQFLTGLAADDAAAGETITVRTTRTVPAGSLVRVIRSQTALDASAQAARPEAAPKRPVYVWVIAHIGAPLAIELTCVTPPSPVTRDTPPSPVTIRVEGDVVEPARTRAVSEADLAEHVGRMGTSPFVPADIQVELDEGVGLGFSAVHKLRAKACDLLAAEILKPYDQRRRGRSYLVARIPGVAAAAQGSLSGKDEPSGREPSASPDSPAAARTPEVCALVTTPAAARAALAAGATRVYVRDEYLAQRQGEQGASTATWPDGVIPWLDEVCREGDHARIDPFVREGAAVGVGNVSELALAAARDAVPEVRACIPVHNTSALAWLEQQGARGVWLSAELSLDEIRTLAPAAAYPVGAVVSGRVRAMTSEHCVLQAADRCIHDCARCRLRQRRLSLRDRDGALMPVRTDLEGRSRIYAAAPLDATPEIPALLEAGVTRFMADCTLLDERETSAAVARVARAVAAARAGKKPDARLAGATTGHLYAPIL